MPDERTAPPADPKKAIAVYVLKTEYYMIFEGKGQFDIKIPRQIDLVTTVSVEVSGKANSMDKIRFFDRTGTEFLAIPLMLLMSVPLFPVGQARPEYRKPIFWGSCLAPENVIVRGWGKEYTKVRQKPASEETSNHEGGTA